MDNFVITIARQYGSGGRTVGKMLAERLGISFYDKQIIHMASDESGIDVNLFGKIEAGETSQQALIREICEELNTKIMVGDLINTIEYDYPTFHLSMDCFWAEVVSGKLELLEAKEAKWLTKDMLDSVKWLPADVQLVEIIKSQMGDENYL